MCFFKTHYYGGIKKYQWVATPLSLHGVICTKNGDVNVTYGENDEENNIEILIIYSDVEDFSKNIGNIENWFKTRINSNNAKVYIEGKTS